MKISEKLYFSRKKIGISQKDLASLLNVNIEKIINWENGSEYPEEKYFQYICNIFDIPLDFLKEEKCNDSVSYNDKNEEQPNKKNESNNSLNELSLKECNVSKKLNNSRLKSIKVWLIIGCVISPLLALSSFIYLEEFSLLFLLLYAITIPICIMAIKCAESAKNHKDLIEWGIISIIFLSFIGGIIMVATDDDCFEFYQGKEIKTRKSRSKKKKCHKNKYNYSKLCDISINNCFRRIQCEKELDAEVKNNLIENLKAIKIKYTNCCTSDKLKACERELNYLMQNFDKKSKKEIFIACFSAVLACCILITSPIIVSSLGRKEPNQQNSQIHGSTDINDMSEYDKLVYMINNYEDINRYKIALYIKELEDTYDLTEIKLQYINAYNYYDLTKYISNYAGTSIEDSNIESTINNISSGYKKVDLIKKDFEKVKKYISIISKCYNSDNIMSNLHLSDSGTIRQYIGYLYSRANSSGIWNYIPYINSLAIPYLINGAKYEYNSYNFQWSLDGKTQRFVWNLPMPSSYSLSSSYDTNVEYSYSTNSIIFRLKSKSNVNLSIDLMKINYAYYDYSMKKLAISVFLYGNSNTTNFIMK